MKTSFQKRHQKTPPPCFLFGQSDNRTTAFFKIQLSSLRTNYNTLIFNHLHISHSYHHRRNGISPCRTIRHRFSRFLLPGPSSLPLAPRSYKRDFLISLTTASQLFFQCNSLNQNPLHPIPNIALVLPWFSNGGCDEVASRQAKPVTDHQAAS